MIALSAQAGGNSTVVRLDDERALIALVCRKDQRAFRTLYDRHVGRVHALCLRLTGNRSMAEEATQEVFLKVWNKVGSFDERSSFSTWLHSVATNTTLSYLRRHRTWKERIFGMDDDEINATEPEAEASTDLTILDRLLPQLPERSRLVFVLHALEGYRHEQIAQSMRISVGASKAHLHRARTLLNHWLGDDDE